MTTRLLPINKDVGCIYLSTLSIFAAALTVAGAGLRQVCFREMGKQFTYHVTLVENHKLVTTGPYSIVRHPAYLGSYFLYIGNMLWHISPGSWLIESQWFKMKLAWLLLAPVFGFTATILLIFKRRTKVEDEMMEMQFGKEWKQWENKVPYRLVPGVY